MSDSQQNILVFILVVGQVSYKFLASTAKQKITEQIRAIKQTDYILCIFDPDELIDVLQHIRTAKDKPALIQTITQDLSSLSM